MNIREIIKNTWAKLVKWNNSAPRPTTEEDLWWWSIR